MHQRIRLLRLAAAALALMTSRRSSVCARSTAAAACSTGHSGRHRQTHDEPDIHRQKYSRHAGHLSPKKLRIERSSTAAIPWLTSVASLRGGSKLHGGAGGGPAGAVAYTRVRRSATICGLFGLSYICSVLFNVNNKRALLLVPLPWTFAALNLLIGSAIALASWSVKVAPWPRIARQDVGPIFTMGLLHAVSHLTVVLGLGAGAVSFLHTVKASEACFTALLSFLFLGQTLPLPVYLTLLPVVAGVALTCCGQGLRFSWVALLSALVSNLSNALRNVLIVKNIGPAAASRRRNRSRDREQAAGASSSPRSISSFQRPAGGATAAAADCAVSNPIAPKIGSAAALANTRAGGATTGGRSGLDDLAPGDTYRLLTVVGAAVLIPAAAYFERDSWPGLWRGATDAAAALVGRSSNSLLGNASRSGAGAAAAAAEVGGGGVAAAAVAGVAEAAAAAAARGHWAEAVRRAVLSGVCFNLFYDLTFRLLGQLHPVTHAVGNTIKRIVVIAAGAFAFGGDLGGARGALGSGLAVVGVLGYSLAKAWCKPTEYRRVGR
ncbi:unnamed protein product [Pylaiella littoralis]